LRPSTAVICAVAFLLHPSILSQHTTFFDIRLAPVFVLWALYYFDKGHLSRYVVFTLLAAMVKENVVLLLFLNGLRALIQRRNGRWIAFSLGFPLLWFALSLWIISLNPTATGNFLGKHFRYLGDSVGEVVARVLKEPWILAGVLVTEPVVKLRSLYERLIPFMGLPLGTALTGLAASDLSIQFLVPEKEAYPVSSNFSSLIVAIFAYSTIIVLVAIRRRHEWLAEQLGYGVLAAALLSLPMAVSPAMFRVDPEFTQTMDRVIEIVGPDASISAPANLVQAFIKRPLVLNNEYHRREDVLSTEYVLVDLWRPDSIVWMSLESDPEYEVVLRSSRLVLFKRLG